MLVRLTDRQWTIVLVSILLVSCMSILSCYLDIDFLRIRDGFSALWLAFMYIIGAYFKANRERFDKIAGWKWLLGYLGCSLLTFLSKPIIAFVTAKVLGHSTMDGMLWSYLSPLVVGAAICLFQLFRGIKLHKMQKVWKNLASATFGVYIIHTHPDAAKLFLNDRFADAAVHMNCLRLLGWVIVYSLILYLACTLIELIRIKLFELVGIPKLTRKIMNLFRRLLFGQKQKTNAEKQ